MAIATVQAAVLYPAAIGAPSTVRHAVDVLSWVAVRVLHDVTADDLGIALVPWPIEIGDEIAVDGDPWPIEVVDLVWAFSGAKVAAMVKVRRAVLHAV